jgi:hypothetical protein
VSFIILDVMEAGGMAKFNAPASFTFWLGGEDEIWGKMVGSWMEGGWRR